MTHFIPAAMTASGIFSVCGHDEGGSREKISCFRNFLYLYKASR